MGRNRVRHEISTYHSHNYIRGVNGLLQAINDNEENGADQLRFIQTERDQRFLPSLHRSSKICLNNSK